jgi:hypothetical protein
VGGRGGGAGGNAVGTNVGSGGGGGGGGGTSLGGTLTPAANSGDGSVTLTENACSSPIVVSPKFTG